MTDPEGAVRVNSVALLALPFVQNEASERSGGRAEICAGTAADTEVSEISRLEEFTLPVQFTEQLAAAPCDAGGVQMETRFTLIAPLKLVAIVFVTVQTVPTAQSKDATVTFVAAPLVDRNRNVCPKVTLQIGRAHV